MTLRISIECHFAECRFTLYDIFELMLNFIMLTVVLLSVSMTNVIILVVVMLSVSMKNVVILNVSMTNVTMLGFMAPEQ
jgi:hypothetical protein